MSQRMLGMLVAAAFAIATPFANAGTQCGCGQVASPCSDCYGSSVVDPYSTGGIVQGGVVSGGFVSGGVINNGIVSGGIVGGGVDGIVSGGIVGGGVAGGIVGGGGCCGSTVQYQSRTVYESQMQTQMRTVTRTRMRTETRTREYTVNLSLIHI